MSHRPALTTDRRFSSRAAARAVAPGRGPLPRRLAGLRLFALLLFLGLGLGAGGCSHMRPIPGTRIPDTSENREVLARVEEYRVAMEHRDASKLLTLAHPNYYEDSGTPTGADDYGFPGLKRVLEARLGALRWLRYLIKYRDIHVEGNRAWVDIRYDISFQLLTEMGEKWERRQNEKRLELIKDTDKEGGSRWLFVSGY
jgi:hypothetical protein